MKGRVLEAVVMIVVCALAIAVAFLVPRSIDPPPPHIPPGRVYGVGGLVLCRPDSGGAWHVPNTDSCVTIPPGSMLWVPIRPGETGSNQIAQ